MAEKFHQRFNIEVSREAAQDRFVARIGNEIFRAHHHPWRYDIDRIRRVIATRLGIDASHKLDLLKLIHGDFTRTLEALEGMYLALSREDRSEFNTLVQAILDMSEVDLGIAWKDGRFVVTGARELDDALVNDVLAWLGERSYSTVRLPFEKALDHLLHARAKPELFSDVITDAKEALEALAKIITGKEGTLEKLAELFLSKVNASNAYKVILKDYCDYANIFRHGASSPSKKPSLTYAEAESFVYLTGLFIRFAMSVGFASSASG